MTKKTGGDILVECLLQESVTKVFGVPGDQLYPILDAIYKNDKIDFVLTRHEQAAAHAADAWARVTGEPGVCLGTVGPGAADLVPGVYPAFADSIPMIVICAQNQTFRSYPDHGSTQGLNQLSLFKGVTKWQVLISHWKRIPHLTQWAFREATSGKPGPVFIDVPSDVLFEAGDQKDLVTPILPPHKYRGLQPIGDITAIKKAAQWLVDAEFPLLHAGGGVLAANASKYVVEIAEHLGAFVTTSPRARGVIPEDHELCLLTAGYGAIAAQATANLVLQIGGKWGDLDFWGKPPAWGEDQRVIQIDIEPTMIGLNRPVDLAIVGDARLTLKELFEEVKSLQPEKKENPARVKEFHETQDAWMADFKEAGKSDAKPIHPLRLIQDTRDFFPRDAISIVDGGNTALWAIYLNRTYNPRTLLWASDSGHLGTVTGYALGAKLAKPDTPVYCLTGDGAFMFNVQEMETLRRLNLPVIIVVANDRAYGMIKAGQKLAYKSRFIGVDFIDIRYDKIAQAMDCFGERVTEPDEIKPALQRAVDSSKPAILDVVIDGSVNLEPPDFETVATIWLEGCTLPED
ncbi:MAG: thiamine pyrophosphate-binding protein [Candidatus Hodarchaeales archaeon]|jgi:acetolactate synthase-1/2/3 large subunit